MEQDDDLLQHKELGIRHNRARPSTSGNPEWQQELTKAKNSWYSLWFRTLQNSERYMECCAAEGVHSLRHLYEDFGDVRTSFPVWWMSTGRHLFAERRPVPKVEMHSKMADLAHIQNMKDRVVLEVPLTLRRSTVIRQINKLLDEAYEGREPVVPRKVSTALRKLHASKVRLDTVRRMLDVYECRAKLPNASLYRIAINTELDIDFQLRSKSAAPLNEKQKRIRYGIEVSRLLRQARLLIANAEAGVFPCLKPLEQEETDDDEN
jgi:hypothetical protein